MKKVGNLKQKIVAILMSVMCLTMIVPSGVTALAAPADDDTYTVTLSESDGGTVTFSDAEGDTALFAEGDEVTLSVTPDDGYTFTGINLTLTETGEVAAGNDDANDTVGYTFTMPAADVTVTASFKEAEDDTGDASFPSEGFATLNSGIMTLATYDSDMIHEKEDNGDYPYPNDMKYFAFDDPDAPGKFSYEINPEYVKSGDVIDEEDIPHPAATGTMFDFGFRAKVQTESAFSLDNPFSLTEKDVCQIGDDWVDLTLYVTKISFGAHVANEYWGPGDGPYKVGDYIIIGGVYSYDHDKNQGQFWFYSDYSAEVTFEWTVEMTYSDTGDVVDVPFDLIVSDIDQGESSVHPFVEQWTVPDSDYSRYDIYEDYNLNITTSNGYTTFAATGNINATSVQEMYAYTGFTGITNSGSFSGSTVCGRTTGSCLTFWCDYVSIFNDPEPDKTIDDPKDAYNTGDVIPYTCTMRMPEYMADTYGTYKSIALVDEIPEGLTYVQDSARAYSGDTDVTDTAGTLTYTDNGDGTETVRFDFDSAWVTDIGNYNGQDLKLKLSCTLDAGYNGEVIENPFVPEIDGLTYTATADAPVTAPTLAITKTADRTAYSLGDTVTYTITVNQTYPGAVAPNTVVTDTLPSELELVGVETNMGTATTDGNSFTVNVGDLWDTDTATIMVTATTLEAADDIENIAYASADDVPEVSDNAVINVQKPGLNIFKTADKDRFYPGDTVTYTIRVVNTNEEAVTEDAEASDVDADEESEDADEDADADVSPESLVPTAYNVVVSDTLPDGLTLVNVIDDADGEIAIDGNSFTVSYPYMYYGDEYTITVEATVNDDVENTTLHNVATVTSDNTDPASDYADIDVVKSILAIEKTADKDVYSVGDTVTYTIDVTQTVEGLTAENVVVTDTMPSEVEFVGAELSGVDGTLAETEGGFTADIPYLSFGETATFTVMGTALTASTGVTNTVTATADHADAVTDDAVVDIMQPALAITKTADKDTCDTGDTVTFTVTVSEMTEGATETNVVMTDPLPAGLTLSGTPSLSGVEGSVTVDGSTITADIPTLTYGESAVITFTATVDDGYAGKTITNTAYAYGDHTDEISDDAAVSVPTANVVGPKTGQGIAGIIAAVVGGSALAMIVIMVRRRRRI